MLNLQKNIILCFLVTQSALCGNKPSEVCTEMMTEIVHCFANDRAPEEMINEWKWGHIKYAFAFTFFPFTNNRQPIGQIFAACPDTGATNRFAFFNRFPNVYDLEERDNPYFIFGLQKLRAEEKYSLVFMSCPKTSIVYPELLKFFKLQEPSCEDVKKTHPSQYWETIAHDGGAFRELHAVDDQFIRWGGFNSKLDWVFRFNQTECTGVMLRQREPSLLPDESMFPAEVTKNLDLRKLTEQFKWISDYQVAQFDKETKERLKRNESGQSSEFNGDEQDRRRLSAFDMCMEKYKVNRLYIQNLGFQSLGVIKTPSSEHFDAPWSEFGYFVSAKSGIVLRSIAFSRGYFNRERVDSFVLDVNGMSKGSDVLLPYGLDITPYLGDYPTKDVLYEHVRSDKRARIIVQPYIACLYHEKKLMKILVCNNKNGPEDHGWSLQRGYYCYEKMSEYYWPVKRAYCPLETEFVGP